MKNHDNVIVQKNSTSDEQSNSNRTTNANRFRRPPSSESSLNASPRKRTEKIRGKEALDILETYHARCRIRYGGKKVYYRNRKELVYRYS